ncbi:MAG: hypothetical protein IH602_23830 [Bryobacteraceae bacterium]|nr:hypothetical protein [Bryobacteraceae bacterium]
MIEPQQGISTVARTGAQSLRVTTPIVDRGVYQEVKDLVPGRTYEFRAWVRAESGTTLAALAVCDPNYSAFVWTGVQTVGTAWQMLSVTFTANSMGVARVHLAKHDITGAQLWDDVELVNGATAVKFVRPAYYPYGQEMGSVTANDTAKFGTYTRDAATGLDYAMNRYYQSTWGRFTSPDPYRASGGPGDPGSWNRYAYTRGDPINFNDPSGLADCNVSGKWTDNSEMYNPQTHVQFWCTSLTGGINVTLTPIFDGDPSDGLIDAEMKFIGKRLDQYETDLFNWLLSQSIIRLTAALAKTDCGSQFKDVSKTLSKLNSVGFGYDDWIRGIIQDGRIVVDRRGPGVAIYNWFTDSINLNRTFNWANPNGSYLKINGAMALIGDSLGGQAFLLRVNSISPEQYMDMTILHELTHFNGIKANRGIDKDAKVEEKLWKNCIQ